MTGWRYLLLVVFLLQSQAAAQDPQEWKRQIDALRKEMQQRLRRIEVERDQFKSELDALKIKYSDLEQQQLQVQDQLGGQIEEIVGRSVKFYERPLPGQKPRSVFSALQGGLIFSGLYRMRFEHRARTVDFDRDGRDDEGVLLDGRFLLGFGAVVVDDQKGDRITAVTEIQGAGRIASNSSKATLGSLGLVAGGDEFQNITLYQAYLEFEGIIADGFRLRAGVQELSFGSEFVLGNSSFFSGLAHGAILAEWRNTARTVRISTFYAKEALTDSRAFDFSITDDFDDDELAGAYLHFEPDDQVTVEAYGLYFNARSPPDSEEFVTAGGGTGFSGAMQEFLQGSFWTFGARIFLSPVDLLGGHLSVNAEAAYQTGSNSVDLGILSVSQSLHGWSSEVIANYRFDKEMQGLAPIVTLAWYYAGGGSEEPQGILPVPPDRIGFQPLFLNRHFLSWDRQNLDAPYFPGGGRLGNMDLIPSSNIHVFKAAISVAAAEDIEVGLGYLLAITADNQGYGTGVFGHELDLFVVYRYPGTSSDIEFSANASVFFPAETARDHSTFLFSGAADPPSGSQASLVIYLQALVAF
jgi:hypothetical protein